ncbi:tryptophan synthase subunit(beta) [Streptomyces parvus]|uniref:tryptophan biosynthesis modulator TrpM n=1 Tax=Streptomyces parvus TaxID=66428 RepID=UPI001239B2F4|nr:tryptophan synthase subunit(beta) [Streptomyces parvus]KAA6198001.1 tryptophan synthase subunit(beta) [Streptomyces parvus]
MTGRPVPHTRPGRAPAGAPAREPHAPPARGCLPPVSHHHPQPRRCAPPFWHRGCRAPARRVHGRRVRYVIGDEPGQVNGMRWRTGSAQ